MNCKPGDLAVMVRSSAGNLGRIVRCVRVASQQDLTAHGVFFSGDVWVTDQPLRIQRRLTGEAVFAPLAPDKYLRPIRPQDGDDETLTWAGKPLRQPQQAKADANERLRELERSLEQGA